VKIDEKQSRRRGPVSPLPHPPKRVKISPTRALSLDRKYQLRWRNTLA